MVKFIQKILSICFVFCLLYACSTKKDTVISRNWHTLNTQFNVLFNGKEAFKKGIDELNQKYEDDFWKLLPIEPVNLGEEKIVAPKFNSSKGPGEGFENNQQTQSQSNSPFDRAEEKAVKAIQKHSMNIYGRERNRQIDDAYLLLGKARYYTERYIPAIEAFNYVIANYPYASLINETKVWRAKANLRIENNKLAIESLKLLLEIRDSLETNLSLAVREEGHTALAMAYIKTDSIQKAIRQLKLATRTQENRAQTARNMFVLGQIYGLQKKKDSAYMVFEKLTNFKKAPYKYKIHANIELAKNATGDSSATAVKERLLKLTENRDNRKFLDALYYQIGVLEEQEDSIYNAIDFYRKSLRAKSGSKKQKSFTYERLGAIYFNSALYEKAGVYYDSVLQVATDSNDVRIRRVKRKYKSLATLIKHENTVRNVDSVLRIASLSKEEQEAFFTKYIDKIKKEDEERAQQQLNMLAFGGANTGNSLQSNNRGSWYFYNNQSLNFGKTEFVKVWGNRKLEDNWRWSSKVAQTTNADADSTNTSKASERYNIETYLSAIPTKKSDLDSLKLSRNEALFELGLSYKEQYKNNTLGIKKLERLLSLSPQQNFILPSNYHLYQAYINLKDSIAAKKYKDVILNDFADTKFAQIISNTKEEENSETQEDVVANFYKEMYYSYKENNFEEVVRKIDSVVPTISNSILIPKFELLKAYATGKYNTKAKYKKALNYIAISYPRTPEGKQAKKILKQLK